MESLNEALATLINQATTGIDASMGFLQAEIPDVIVQLLMWHVVKSGIFCVAGLVIFYFLARASHKYGIFIKDEIKKDIDGVFLLLPYGLAHLLYLFPLVWINFTWLQIWIAPKVWLLEYAASLVK